MVDTRVEKIAANLHTPMLGRLVTIKHLKVCTLWPGSLLEQSARYSGLTLGECCDKAMRLQACDDRTPDENKLLDALRVTIRESING